MAVSERPEQTAGALIGAEPDGEEETNATWPTSSLTLVDIARPPSQRRGRRRRFGARDGAGGAHFDSPSDPRANNANGRPHAGPGADRTPERETSGQPDNLAARIGLPRRPAELQGDRRGFVLRRWLLLADVAGLFAAMLIVELFGGLAHRSPLFDLASFVVAVPAWLLLIRAYGLYHVDSRRADHGLAEEIAPMLQMTALSSWGLLLLVSATGVAQVSISRLALLWITAFGLLLTLRAATRARARRRAWYRQSTLVVGTPTESEAFLAKIRRHPEYGIEVVACLDLSTAADESRGAESPDSGLADSSAPGHLSCGEAQVVQIVDELHVDRVMIGSSVGSLCEHSTLLYRLGERSVHVDLVPGWAETVGSRLEMTEMEGMPILALPRTRIPRSSLLFKRLLDMSISGTLLVILAPLLALCALAIKLDTPGPVLFRQRRVGRGGHRFEILKFRSMHREADSAKHELADLTLHGGAGANGIFKIANDPRVTRVGRVLRRFSLDELPQLLNILRGDMSLVGPRPLPEDEHERITGRFRRRIDLMPGLTGLWQVHGRSAIPFDDMVDLDYLYVTTWSLWRDIKLLVRTFVVVVLARGAY